MHKVGIVLDDVLGKIFSYRAIHKLFRNKNGGCIIIAAKDISDYLFCMQFFCCWYCLMALEDANKHWEHTKVSMGWILQFIYKKANKITQTHTSIAKYMNSQVIQPHGQETSSCFSRSRKKGRIIPYKVLFSIER